MKQKPFLLFISTIVFVLPSFSQQTQDYKPEDYNKLQKIPNAKTPTIQFIYGSISGYIACQFPNKNLKRLELENYKLYAFEVKTSYGKDVSTVIAEIGHKIAEATIVQIDKHRDSLHYEITNVPVNKDYILMLCYAGDRTPSILDNESAIQSSFSHIGAGITTAKDSYGQKLTTKGLMLLFSYGLGHFYSDPTTRHERTQNITISPL